jgi:hypothetical protein
VPPDDTGFVHLSSSPTALNPVRFMPARFRYDLPLECRVLSRDNVPGVRSAASHKETIPVVPASICEATHRSPSNTSPRLMPEQHLDGHRALDCDRQSRETPAALRAVRAWSSRAAISVCDHASIIYDERAPVPTARRRQAEAGRHTAQHADAAGLSEQDGCLPGRGAGRSYTPVRAGVRQLRSLTKLPRRFLPGRQRARP